MLITDKSRMKAFRALFHKVKAGEPWILDFENGPELRRGDLEVGLTSAIHGYEDSVEVDYRVYVEILDNIIIPMMILFTGFGLEYVRAFDDDENELPILTSDLFRIDSSDQNLQKELSNLTHCEFRVVKVS